MKVAKTSLQQTESIERFKPAPPQPEILSNPEDLLASLKAKAQLFSQLKKEGLIHQDQLPMETKLQETIHDLEHLLSKLKEPA